MSHDGAKRRIYTAEPLPGIRGERDVPSAGCREQWVLWLAQLSWVLAVVNW